MSTIRVLVGSTVKSENLAEVLDLYDELVRETRREDGCISYELLQRTDEPGELMLVEEWQSQAHLDAHTHTEHFVRLVAALDRLEQAAPAMILSKVL
ncbi:antibiotic biosynthesis monooxygenase [Rhodococcus sp. SRB_17]|uniref:putative quinol monooxygenase n=1 Tax=Rhodococcus sp. OK302 TaxID=1882769 RepID=UPI000B9418BA|nr:putative quinol monooxygenase [Rhodococcus sp. OK302]NMM87494.1 antibiotic biosynthesis monooxygenase [Rhodococcus sp. SRB_17]OYD71208.1 quinol monooxygenase YgiN [Rhodococcus sp. OK302]